MQTCWRCGQPSGESVECQRCTAGNVTFTPAAGSQLQMIPIDFAKVDSVEDLKTILSQFGLCVLRGSPSHVALAKYLL